MSIARSSARAVAVAMALADLWLPSFKRACIRFSQRRRSAEQGRDSGDEGVPKDPTCTGTGIVDPGMVDTLGCEDEDRGGKFLLGNTSSSMGGGLDMLLLLRSEDNGGSRGDECAERGVVIFDGERPREISVTSSLDFENGTTGTLAGARPFPH